MLLDSCKFERWEAAFYSAGFDAFAALSTQKGFKWSVLNLSISDPYSGCYSGY